MGEARRRKKALGFAYGTPECSNKHEDLVLSFRYMTRQEHEKCEPSIGEPWQFLIGSIDGVEFPLAAKMVIDAHGNFNSYVRVQSSTKIDQIPGKPLQGARKTKDHRELNKFLYNNGNVRALMYNLQTGESVMYADNTLP
jgi:hypothetical protein